MTLRALKSLPRRSLKKSLWRVIVGKCLWVAATSAPRQKRSKRTRTLNRPAAQLARPAMLVKMARTVSRALRVTRERPAKPDNLARTDSQAQQVRTARPALRATPGQQGKTAPQEPRVTRAQPGHKEHKAQPAQKATKVIVAWESKTLNAPPPVTGYSPSQTTPP